MRELVSEPETHIGMLNGNVCVILHVNAASVPSIEKCYKMRNSLLLTLKTCMCVGGRVQAKRSDSRERHLDLLIVHMMFMKAACVYMQMRQVCAHTT